MHSRRFSNARREIWRRRNLCRFPHPAAVPALWQRRCQHGGPISRTYRRGIAGDKLAIGIGTGSARQPNVVYLGYIFYRILEMRPWSALIQPDDIDVVAPDGTVRSRVKGATIPVSKSSLMT